mmetsp:Transcript_2022/g.2877  ORF Transcript_2022/g.2877 Transcript_2022/m.2877 type:complete len:116 (-) Transcript_2022:73-420(-)|eukprot:CAMPEP_0201551966 /NCGR_PEP_ID=MMETSP0173_2-20130828/12170_1 /ASSEMBLY_ACC=CAM_ASM_000268 /TAXON_ID=218659 /ORGANISM="Vexillifera sp., Strain DIVA3 564/2" /LENGTH=115 /DNA_ID=CAMNT_0047962343 /DNA_START=22 /DNA_END=369 /DNA_ORIENTATION=-
MSASSSYDSSSDSDTGFSLKLGGNNNKPSYDDESNIHSALKVTFKLPENKVIEKEVTAGHTVFMMKKMLADEDGLPFDNLEFKFGDKTMLGPLSLNDFPELSDKKECTIVVTIKK